MKDRLPSPVVRPFVCRLGAVILAVAAAATRADDEPRARKADRQSAGLAPAAAAAAMTLPPGFEVKLLAAEPDVRQPIAMAFDDRGRLWVAEAYSYSVRVPDADARGGGHAHSGAMIYLGGAWSDRYRGQLFMNNIHGDRLNVDRLFPSGSGFLGDGEPDFLFANDTWSQFISIQYGPDGHVTLLDWYDAVACHQQRDRVDRDNGRIFKVVHVGDGELPPAPVHPDLAAQSDAELVGAVGRRRAGRAAGSVPRGDLPSHIVAQLAASADPAVLAKMNAVWGTIRAPATDKQAELASWRDKLGPRVLNAANLGRGRQVYEKTCGSCHALHGVGGRLGPELTGSNRGDLDYLLVNLLDPSAVVGRDYQMTTVVTEDGRALAGIVVADSPERLTLRTPTEDVTVPTAEIETRMLSPRSMMPEDLLGPLSFEQARDLIAYLRHPTQVPMPDR